MYVYLFEADGGAFKIGRSKSPAGRLRDFAGLPFNVRLVHSIRSGNAGWLESHLHRHFKACRISREWFRLTPKDVATIVGIARCEDAGGLPEELRPKTRVRPRRISQASPSQFGWSLQRFRQAAGLSQAGLADRAGTSRRTVIKIEQGEHDPRWMTAVALAQAMGLEVTAFLPKSP